MQGSLEDVDDAWIDETLGAVYSWQGYGRFAPVNDLSVGDCGEGSDFGSAARA